MSIRNLFPILVSLFVSVSAFSYEHAPMCGDVRENLKICLVSLGGQPEGVRLELQEGGKVAASLGTPQLSVVSSTSQQVTYSGTVSWQGKPQEISLFAYQTGTQWFGYFSNRPAGAEKFATSAEFWMH